MGSMEHAKEELGRWAASQVTPSSILGIGSGTTVMAFIDALGERMRREPLPLTVAVASVASAERARAQGLAVVPLESVVRIDCAVDGADAVDSQGTLIKGGGAALVRERLIIASAERVMILVDASKPMNHLHDVVVPLAILPFGWRQTLERVQSLVSEATLRVHDNGPVITDDGLYLIDAPMAALYDADPWHHRLKMLAGVVDTGIFTGYHPEVFMSCGTGEGPVRLGG